HKAGRRSAQLCSPELLKRPLLAALGIALAARAAPILFGYEHYGDAPVRIELAERWAQDPHLWRGYLEAWQYGPLHLTLIGALVRYDGWLYVPLCGALLWLRQRNLARSVAFCAVAAAPALFWLWVNARFAGDALAPLRHIDRDHAMLARMAADSFGSLRVRLQH